MPEVLYIDIVHVCVHKKSFNRCFCLEHFDRSSGEIYEVYLMVNVYWSKNDCVCVIICEQKMDFPHQTLKYLVTVSQSEVVGVDSFCLKFLRSKEIGATASTALCCSTHKFNLSTHFPYP